MSDPDEWEDEERQAAAEEMRYQLEAQEMDHFDAVELIKASRVRRLPNAAASARLQRALSAPAPASQPASSQQGCSGVEPQRWWAWLTRFPACGCWQDARLSKLQSDEVASYLRELQDEAPGGRARAQMEEELDRWGDPPPSPMYTQYDVASLQGQRRSLQPRCRAPDDWESEVAASDRTADQDTGHREMVTMMDGVAGPGVDSGGGGGGGVRVEVAYAEVEEDGDLMEGPAEAWDWEALAGACTRQQLPPPCDGRVTAAGGTDADVEVVSMESLHIA
jgi:hypothetical protein